VPRGADAAVGHHQHPAAAELAGERAEEAERAGTGVDADRSDFGRPGHARASEKTAGAWIARWR
jgi:hypothetical protein